MAGEDLHADAGGGDVRLRRLELGHGAGAAAVEPVVVEPGRALDEQSRRLDLGLDVREGVRERLELADRAPERVALLGIGERLVDGRLRGADVAAADEHPLEVDAREHHLPPAVDGPDEVVLGHLDVAEEDLVGAEDVAGERVDLAQLDAG